MNKVALFVAITFFISYLSAFIFFSISQIKYATYIFATGYMFMPMLATLFVQKLYRESIKELGVSFKPNRWWIVAWLLPPFLAFMTLAISLLFPGVEYSPEMEGFFERLKDVLPAEAIEEMKEQIKIMPIHPVWIALIQGLIFGITINAIPAFGEEIGWRGFLQKELSYMNFWRSSTIIGVIWGIWHAPLILQGHNYPQHPVAGVFMMTAWCILLSPIFSYVRLKAGSVISAAIMHGSLNATYNLSIILVEGGNDLIIGLTGLAGFITLGIINLLILLYDKFIVKESIAELIKNRDKLKKKVKMRK
jgi:membrane protease YdiL (CAAX protease family)